VLQLAQCCTSCQEMFSSPVAMLLPSLHTFESLNWSKLRASPTPQQTSSFCLMLFVETTVVYSDICEKYVHAFCCKVQNFVVLKKVAGLLWLLHAYTGWYRTATLEHSAMPLLLAGTLPARGGDFGCYPRAFSKALVTSPSQNVTGKISHHSRFLCTDPLRYVCWW